MVGERKVSDKRHPLKLLAIFAVALTLQGMNLAVFQGDRSVGKSAWEGRRSAWTEGGIMASKLFTVTNVSDEGPGSLRQAIKDANENPGLDEIVFDFTEPVTITLSAPLIITDPVSMEAHGTYITDTLPGSLTLDGSSLAGNMFQITTGITNTVQSSFRRLRLVNIIDGFGFQISDGLGGNVIISSTVLNSMGGVQLQNSANITLTHNLFQGMREIGVQALGGEGVLLQENKFRNSSGTAVSLLDGLNNSVIISNSINGVFGDEFGAAMFVGGDPAPTGIVMRSNTFTNTVSPISFGPGVNFGFPAPEIVKAYEPITDTRTLNFSASSPADPISYTYPLVLDLYRVRDGNYLPLGASVMYQVGDFPSTITYTARYTDTIVFPSDGLALIATTSNPNSSLFSSPVPLLPPPDQDNDGVADGDDLCPDTSIPEENVPSSNLGVNRFALVDGDLEFDTIESEGEGPGRSYTIAETGGCSCEQIIEELGLGGGHARFGCSISVMDEWVSEVNLASKRDAVGSDMPENFALEQNYPNPFNPTTSITFKLPERGRVAVRIFDTMGREVTTLINEELEPGSHQVQWDGRNAQGYPVSTGVYIYRINAGKYSSAKTMILHR